MHGILSIILEITIALHQYFGHCSHLNLQYYSQLSSSTVCPFKPFIFLL